MSVECRVNKVKKIEESRDLRGKGRQYYIKNIVERIEMHCGAF